MGGCVPFVLGMQHLFRIAYARVERALGSNTKVRNLTEVRTFQESPVANTALGSQPAAGIKLRECPAETLVCGAYEK